MQYVYNKLIFEVCKLQVMLSLSLSLTLSPFFSYLFLFLFIYKTELMYFYCPGLIISGLIFGTLEQ